MSHEEYKSFLRKIVSVDKAWYTGTRYRMEEVMKVSEFVKNVIIPVAATLFLVAMLRPLCMENGECDYLKLWFFVGIPFGIHRMFVWVIPTGYGISETMGILSINVIVGGIIGAVVVMCKMLLAAVYSVKAAVAVVVWIVRKLMGKPGRAL